MNGVCGQSEDYIRDVALFVPFYPKRNARLFSAVEFSTKIFHSFEENKHFYMEYHKLSK